MFDGDGPGGNRKSHTSENRICGWNRSRTLFTSLGIAYWAYNAALYSVWCFFAAILSLIIFAHLRSDLVEATKKAAKERVREAKRVAKERVQEAKRRMGL